MRGAALLEEMMNLAKSRGMSIRKETMTRGAGAGGLCVLKGVPTVFVDEKASVDAQIEVLATVLRRFEWDDSTLVPAVRSLLTTKGAATGSSEGEASSGPGTGDAPKRGASSRGSIGRGRARGAKKTSS